MNDLSTWIGLGFVSCSLFCGQVGAAADDHTAIPVFNYQNFVHEVGSLGPQESAKVVRLLQELGAHEDAGGVTSIASFSCRQAAAQDQSLCSVAVGKNEEPKEVGLKSSPSLQQLDQILRSHGSALTEYPSLYTNPAAIACVNYNQPLDNCLILFDLGYDLHTYSVSSTAVRAVGDLISRLPPSLNTALPETGVALFTTDRVSVQEVVQGRDHPHTALVLERNRQAFELQDASAAAEAATAWTSITRQDTPHGLGHKAGFFSFNCVEVLDGTHRGVCAVTERSHL